MCSIRVAQEKEELNSKLARTISLVVIMLELTGGTPVHARWQCNGSLWCHACRTPFSSSSLERTRNTVKIGLNPGKFALELNELPCSGHFEAPNPWLLLRCSVLLPSFASMRKWKLPHPADLMCSVFAYLCNTSMMFHAFCSATPLTPEYPQCVCVCVVFSLDVTNSSRLPGSAGLDYIVPFMISVLLAKAVGDSLNEGLANTVLWVPVAMFAF